MNAALQHLGERQLTALSDEDESRYVLDLHYDTALRYCLEQVALNPALRTVQVDSSAGMEPLFGYTYAFEKPTDWLRTVQVSGDDTFSHPLDDFSDEANLWYAWIDPIYVQYVSSDSSYGLDLANWPETFAEYVSVRLAIKSAKRLTGAGQAEMERLEKLEKKARVDARAKDAMNQGVGRMPQGAWSMARGGSRVRNPRSQTLGY